MLERREYLSKQYKHCPCEYHQLEKLIASRECNKMKNQLKRDYIKTSLDRHTNDPKKIWQTITEFWPNSSKSTVIKRIKETSDNAEMANILNTHFATVASHTIDSGNFTENIYNYLPPHHAPSF